MVCAGGRCSQLWQIDSKVDNFHNSRPSQEVIHNKIILKGCFNSSVENIFIQSIFSLYMWEPNLTNIVTMTQFSLNTYVDIILKSCWYNFCINPTELFNDIFPVSRVRWMKPAFSLTNGLRYLVYGWNTKSVSIKTNKQKNQHNAAR